MSNLQINVAQTRLRKLTTTYLAFHIISSATAFSDLSRPVKGFNLVSRANTCAVSGQTACTGTGIPSNFCCGSNTKCQVFNNNKSVICCPLGHSCNTIAPLTCDLSAQNATLHPSNQLHSSDLSGTLQVCGDSCCPRGYSCQNNQCALVTTSATPKASVASTGASTTKSASSTSADSLAVTGSSHAPTSKPTTSTARQQAAATSTSCPSPTAHCNKFPYQAILAGFFPGMLLGAILTILAIICLGRRRSSDKSDLSSVTATVSDPIYQPQGSYRTDFLRRESKSKYLNRTSSKVRSLFSRTPTMVNRDNNPGATGKSVKEPVTPVRTPSMRKEPSSESIRIYSPPNGGLGVRNTTFTDMMADAGFKQGEPYLGSPGRVDPRSRGVGA